MLRLINAALNDELFFRVADHNLTVVDVDGVYVKPFDADIILISTGQTSNLLLRTKRSHLPHGGPALLHRLPRHIRQHHRRRCAQVRVPNCRLPQGPPPPRADPARELRQEAAQPGHSPVPGEWPTNDTMFAAAINNVSFVTPATALLQAHYFGQSTGVYTQDFPAFPAAPFDYTREPPSNDMALGNGTRLAVLPFNTSVEVVMQDTNILVAESHPLHLHGFNFFVVGQGPGNFDPENDPASFNLVDPVERNTVAVPAGGWVAIRFLDDNPGPLLHLLQLWNPPPPPMAATRRPSTDSPAAAAASPAIAATDAATHHLVLAEKALEFLRRRVSLDSLAASYTPDAAVHTLLLAQPHRLVLLSFLRWATPLPFFSSSLLPQSLSLHLLSRLRHLPAALSLARRLATRFPAPSLFHSLTSTLPLLRPAPTSPSVAFDLLIRSYSSLSLIPQALSVLTLTKNAGFSPSLLSFNSLLDAMFRSRQTPLRAIDNFLADMASSGVSRNVYTYNILIRGFCSRGELHRASALLPEMVHAGCSPNVVTYNTLIDGLCKSGKIDDAMSLLRTIKEKGLKPNLITCNSIVNGLCRKGRLKESRIVLDDMAREGLTPDSITYNTIVNGYCREGDLHQALLMEAEMARKGVAPNVVTYNSLVNAMCKDGNMRRAMELVGRMKERGLELDEFTFTTLIDGFCKKGFLDDALLLLNQMQERGIQASIASYNALINGYCLLGRTQEALQILREDMERYGLAPDVVTYSTILNSHCRNGDIDLAFQLNQEMLDKGIMPDAITYSSLIRGLCGAKRLDDAWKHFRQMLRLGLRPDEFTYTTLIHGHCKEGELEKAVLLHDEMIKKGILPDVVTYGVLINGLRKVARIKEAKRLLLRMCYDESVPDCIEYDILMECCGKAEFKSVLSLLKSFCAKGLMNEADKVFESMSERNWKLDATAYNIVIHGHCRAGNVSKAMSLYEEMIQAEFELNAITAIALIRALSKHSRNEELNQVIQRLLGGCLLTDAKTSKAIVEVNHMDGNIDAVLDALTNMAKDGFLPNGSELKGCTR
ncbi:hypothetical protein ZIOFF_062577 [Zingiber officinale]|uniref:Uncharacterized protein n=2 Tax=Zingiber officinale TaxID=94328 RepID=A0A8J5F5K6_ZINOF|nr:hypothetical protein ZIOFF_062577 [Zingiber officinale]